MGRSESVLGTRSPTAMTSATAHTRASAARTMAIRWSASRDGGVPRTAERKADKGEVLSGLGRGRTIVLSTQANGPPFVKSERSFFCSIVDGDADRRATPSQGLGGP